MRACKDRQVENRAFSQYLLRRVGMGSARFQASSALSVGDNAKAAKLSSIKTERLTFVLLGAVCIDVYNQRRSVP
jgi:ABC-type xylose transport system permease subunit